MIYILVVHSIFLSEFIYFYIIKQLQNAIEQKAKGRKWRRTLASLQRLRLNKDDDESDARGDLSSAIVTSVAMELPETTDDSKPAQMVCNKIIGYRLCDSSGWKCTYRCRLVKSKNIIYTSLCYIV